VNIEIKSVYALTVDAEELKIIKTGLVALNWDQFPLAESMSDKIADDADVFGYDIQGEAVKA
jgi:hypothetical protein